MTTKHPLASIVTVLAIAYQTVNSNVDMSPEKMKKHLLEALSGILCGAIIIIPMMAAYWLRPFLYGGM